MAGELELRGRVRVRVFVVDRLDEVRVLVRFKKGDDVWELTADPTTGSPSYPPSPTAMPTASLTRIALPVIG